MKRGGILNSIDCSYWRDRVNFKVPIDYKPIVRSFFLKFSFGMNP